MRVEIEDQTAALVGRDHALIRTSDAAARFIGVTIGKLKQISTRCPAGSFTSCEP